MNIKLKLVLTAITLTFLVACGGGGDSSSGAGSSDNDGVFKGSFKRSETYASDPNGEANNFAGAITITIAGGQVAINDSSLPSIVVNNMSGNKFTVKAIYKTSFCKNAQRTYTGTVSGNKVSGKIAGKLSCLDSQGAYKLSLTGSFSATKS